MAQRKTRQLRRTDAACGLSFLLVSSLIASALVIGLAGKTGRYPYLACLSLVPLFAAIRTCRPMASFLSGVIWGLSLFGFCLVGLGPPISPTLDALVLLAAVPALYAWLGTLLTRWIGFSPFVLAVCWILVECSLLPLHLRLGLLGGTQIENTYFQIAGHAFGYLQCCLLVAYIGAAFFDVACTFSSIKWSRATHLRIVRDSEPISVATLFRRIAAFWLRTSQPRAPPLMIF